MRMAQAKKSGTNWFAVLIATVTVVAIVGVGAIVVMLNNSVKSPTGEQQTPSGQMINTATGAISFGEGETVVATYLDFACPHCKTFETTFGSALNAAQGDGKITLDVHPIAIVSVNAQHTGFSTRSASAMYCVAENATPAQALDFLGLMFANQDNGSLSDSQIVEIARAAGAGDASSCIRSRQYVEYVDTMTRLTPPNPETQSIGTPTLVVDGEYVKSADWTTVLLELLG